MNDLGRLLGGISNLDFTPSLSEACLRGGGIECHFHSSKRKCLARSAGAKYTYIDSYPRFKSDNSKRTQKRTQNVCPDEAYVTFCLPWKTGESDSIKTDQGAISPPMLLLSPEKLKRVGLESENAFNIPKTG